MTVTEEACVFLAADVRSLDYAWMHAILNSLAVKINKQAATVTLNAWICSDLRDLFCLCLKHEWIPSSCASARIHNLKLSYSFSSFLHHKPAVLVT